MKVTELINELEKLKTEHWDINVEVQYRDWWWCYHWTDEYVSPIYRENKWWKAIIL